MPITQRELKLNTADVIWWVGKYIPHKTDIVNNLKVWSPLTDMDQLNPGVDK